MSYQTIFNPYTGQIKVIDLSQSSAQQQIMSLYQQGWRSGPPPVSVSTMKTSVPTATPAIPPAVNEDAYYQQMYGMTKQQWINTPTHTAIIDNKIVNLADVKLEKAPESITYEGMPGEFILQGGKIYVTQAEYDKLGPGAKKSVEVIKSPSKTSIIKEIALSSIPIYGTIRNWNKMGTGGKALSIVTDLLWVVPFVSGVSTAVRTTTTTNRAVALAQATTRTVIAEVKAPLTAIRHPIKTAKTALEPLETLVRPSKLPLSGLEIRYSTQRIPVIGTNEATMALRDQVTQSLILGQKGKGISGVAKLEVFQPKAMQGIRPAAIHTTPDIRPFLEGATIQTGREGGLFVAPSYHTRFGIASAFGDVSKGGQSGALLIRDEKILQQLAGSQKLYRGKAEVERVIQGGIELPKPSQTLISRTVDGERITILIYGKPLSKAEIARFKLVGSADTVRTLFTPSVSVKGARLSKAVDELEDIERRIIELKRANVAGTRAGLSQLGRRADVLRQEIGRLSSGRAEYVLTNTSNRAVVQTPQRPAMANGRRVMPIVELDERGNYRVYGREEPVVRDRVNPPTKDRVIPVSLDRATPDVPDRTPPPESPRRDITNIPDRVEPPVPDRGRANPPDESVLPPPVLRKRQKGEASLEIERVEGIPRNPGIIRWNKGVVQVEIVPPYREGSEDIHFSGLKQPQKGKGSQERTLTVVKGQAPKLVVLGRQGGIAKTHIIRGKKMKHIRQIIRQRGPGVIDSRGNLHKQRRGSVI